MNTNADTFRAKLTGISGILVTPFDKEDRLVPALLKPVIDRAIQAGVHILTANGNTGEFYGLTTAEAEQAVHAAGELIDGRVPLLAGIGRSIGDALALTKASRAAGAAGADGAPAARPVRRTARRGGLCAAHRRGGAGAADCDLSAQ